jgi:hypothetical protein
MIATQTIAITKEIVETAITTYDPETDMSVTNHCVVFHALKAAGLPVAFVGIYWAQMIDGTVLALPPKAQQVARTLSGFWHLIQPLTFELDLTPTKTRL